MNNHYQTLGLKPGASKSDIKIAYHTLAKKFHPDVNHNDSRFNEILKDINIAYEALKNYNPIPSKKSKQDFDYRDFEDFFEDEDPTNFHTSYSKKYPITPGIKISVSCDSKDSPLEIMLTKKNIIEFEGRKRESKPYEKKDIISENEINIQNFIGKIKIPEEINVELNLSADYMIKGIIKDNGVIVSHNINIDTFGNMCIRYCQQNFKQDIFMYGFEKHGEILVPKKFPNPTKILTVIQTQNDDYDLNGIQHFNNSLGQKILSKRVKYARENGTKMP